VFSASRMVYFVQGLLNEFYKNETLTTGGDKLNFVHRTMGCITFRQKHCIYFYT